MFVKSAVNEAEYVMKYNKDLGGGYSPKLNGVTYGYAKIWHLFLRDKRTLITANSKRIKTQ